MFFLEYICTGSTTMKKRVFVAKIEAIVYQIKSDLLPTLIPEKTRAKIELRIEDGSARSGRWPPSQVKSN